MSETNAADAAARKTPPRSMLVALALGGIVLPGLVSYLLDAEGLVLLSDIVWVSSYAVVVLLGWYGWIRPLDIRGPD